MTWLSIDTRLIGLLAHPSWLTHIESQAPANRHGAKWRLPPAGRFYIHHLQRARAVHNERPFGETNMPQVNQPQNKSKIMGDKSPKSKQKKSSQKQAGKKPGGKKK